MQEKEQFFAQYSRQEVLFRKGVENPVAWSYEEIIREFTNIDPVYAILRPLSSITDEEAVEVATILEAGTNHRKYTVERREDRAVVWFAQWCVHIGYNCVIRGSQAILYHSQFMGVSDYLRSRGFLIGWRNYTPEQLIEMGWVKLCYQPVNNL